MAVIVPFRAIRPRKPFVKDVASYPYDVLNAEEAGRLARANPLSFLHVEKAEVDVPDFQGVDDARIYASARTRLEAMLDDGVLFQEAEPCLYLYRQVMAGRPQYGLVAGARVAEYEAGLIRKHELTRADKETERIRHVDEVNAHTGPVFVVYRAREAVDALLARTAEGEPEYDFTADDGIVHTVWVIRDAGVVDALKREFAQVEALYIADGHHRAAAAAAVARMRRERNPGHRGREGYNAMLGVLFPHDQVRIMDYNRAVRDLQGRTPQAFLAAIEEHFSVSPDFQDKSPRERHAFGMYLDGRWYRLVARPGTYDAGDPVAALDVSILQENLLRPLLGIGDPRTDGRIDFIGGIRGMEALERRVDREGYAVAFSLFPPTLEELMGVADAGRTMPPKSTWFEPKLRSGIFVHSLDDAE